MPPIKPNLLSTAGALEVQGADAELITRQMESTKAAILLEDGKRFKGDGKLRYRSNCDRCSLNVSATDPEPLHTGVHTFSAASKLGLSASLPQVPCCRIYAKQILYVLPPISKLHHFHQLRNKDTCPSQVLLFYTNHMD